MRVFVDAGRVLRDSTLETHLCIVGGGAAGIALAQEFIGSRVGVTVLESGGLEPHPKTQGLYEGKTSGIPYFPLEAARLRYFGGSTNHWGGVSRPLDEIDFEPREGIPLSGWPIGKNDLQPFYEPAQVLCHVPSGQWDYTDWRDRDSHAPLPLTGGRVVTRFAQMVEKPLRSFGERYRDEIGRARNVAAYLNANVIEIETEAEAKTATRVRIATLDGNRFWVAARCFVLAIGGIENARLLLASNSRRPNGLGNDHDLVGRFFLEHPRYVAGTLIPFDRHLATGFYRAHPVGKALIKGYLALPAMIKRAEGLVDVQMRLSPVYEESFERAIASDDVDGARSLAKAARQGNVDDFGHHLLNTVEDLMSWQKFTVPAAPLPLPHPDAVAEVVRSTPRRREALVPEFLGDIVGVAYQKTGRAPLKTAEVVTRLEPAPNKDSRITLTAARDELGMNRVKLDWRLSRIDRHSARRALEILGGEIGRAGIGRLKILGDERERSWPADLAGGWHHMGTTRMSDDPRRGVVDKNGRVHGMTNLYVAGSSVFPTAGSGTPTLTLVALTLRLAKHLKRSLR
jgi:choline dehydrogenase-like flavoprotein